LAPQRTWPELKEGAQERAAGDPLSLCGSVIDRYIQLEENMSKTTVSVMALVCAGLGLTLTNFVSAPAYAQNQNMEVIHHPNYDKNVFMPFVPAIKIKSGKILWLAGTTALPVYHDHPHKRDEIQKYMVNDLEAQTRAAMDGIKQTLDASGASFKDVVHFFVFRARPRMGDIGKASAVINSYFAPFNHKPTSTNVAVLELGEPEQLIEIQMFAVVD
jgi:enamine deaminase RidA (YjgF/YER057c/UK114 family)